MVSILIVSGKPYVCCYTKFAIETSTRKIKKNWNWKLQVDK